MDPNGGGGGAKSTIRSQILNLKERDSDLLSKPPSSFPVREKRKCRKQHNRGSREAPPSTTKNPPPPLPRLCYQIGTLTPLLRNPIPPLQFSISKPQSVPPATKYPAPSTCNFYYPTTS